MPSSGTRAYPTEDLVLGADAIFAVSPQVAAAALYGGVGSYTLNDAARAISALIGSPVAVQGEPTFLGRWTVGDGTSSSFTITHGLADGSPHVTVWDYSQAPPQLIGASVSLSGTDPENTIVVSAEDWVASPPGPGSIVVAIVGGPPAEGVEGADATMVFTDAGPLTIVNEPAAGNVLTGVDPNHAQFTAPTGGGGGAPTGAAGGDLSGTYPNPSVGTVKGGKTPLTADQNLADVTAPTARTNLGLGTAATHPSTDFDVSGAAATAQAASLQKASNLSDVASAATARTNLGLGSAATHPSTDFDAAGLSAAETARATAAEGTNAAAITAETTRAEVAEAAAQAAAIAASAQGLVPTVVKTSAYTAAAGDFVPVDISGGSVTVTLPNAPADKTRIGVKVVKISGTPGSTTCSVARAGADVFNVAAGSTSLTLTALFQGVLLQYSHSAAIWYVSTADSPVGTALGAAQLGSDGTVGGPSGSPITTSVLSAATVPSIEAYGASWVTEFGATNARYGFIERLAKMLGNATVNKVGFNGGRVADVGTNGGVAMLLENGLATDLVAGSYVTRGGLKICLGPGFNDWVQYHSVTNGPATVENALTSAFSRLLAARIVPALTAGPALNAAITYSGFSALADPTPSLFSIPPGLATATVNGSYVQWSTDAAYKGEAISMLLPTSPSQGAIVTVTADGTTVATVDTRVFGTAVAAASLTGGTFCVRLPAGTLAAGVRVLRLTYASISSFGTFGGFIIEGAAPLIIPSVPYIGDASYSTAQADWTNARNANVAALFPSALGVDITAALSPNYPSSTLDAANWGSGGTVGHPSNLGNQRIAALLQPVVRGLLTPAAAAAMN